VPLGSCRRSTISSSDIWCWVRSSMAFWRKWAYLFDIVKPPRGTRSGENESRLLLLLENLQPSFHFVGRQMDVGWSIFFLTARLGWGIDHRHELDAFQRLHSALFRGEQDGIIV